MLTPRPAQSSPPHRIAQLRSHSLGPRRLAGPAEDNRHETPDGANVQRPRGIHYQSGSRSAGLRKERRQEKRRSNVGISEPLLRDVERDRMRERRSRHRSLDSRYRGLGGRSQRDPIAQPAARETQSPRPRGGSRSFRRSRHPAANVSRARALADQRPSTGDDDREAVRHGQRLGSRQGAVLRRGTRP